MNEQTNPNLILEFGLFSLLAVLWGSSYLFLKVAVADIPPLTLVALRVSIASVFLLIVMRHRGDRLPSNKDVWLKLLVLAFFNSIGAWTLLAWSIQHVDSGLASVLNSTSPVFVFFITFLVTRHEPVSGLKLAGACLGIAGVVLIVGIEALDGLGVQVVGQIAALAGALLYACAAIYGKKLALPPSIAAAGTMMWAACILVPVSLIMDHPWTLTPSLNAMAAAIVLSVFCTGVALLIYFRLLRTLGSMGVASQAYLRAVVGVVLGVVLLGEGISAVVVSGIVMCLAGVVVINLPAKPRRIKP